MTGRPWADAGVDWQEWARQALGMTAMVAGTVLMFSVVLAARWLSEPVRYGG